MGIAETPCWSLVAAGIGATVIAVVESNAKAMSESEVGFAELCGNLKLAASSTVPAVSTKHRS